jgi:hypothetical protein
MIKLYKIPSRIQKESIDIYKSILAAKSFSKTQLGIPTLELVYSITRTIDTAISHLPFPKNKIGVRKYNKNLFWQL